ncbi:MAG: TonB-dependent receptor [Pseudomonadota bacterium]
MKTKISKLYLALLATTGTLLSPTLFAAEGEEAERMEVVGSHIKRTDIEGPSPILTIDRDNIEKSGYNNLQQLLEKLPVAGTGTFSTQGNNQDSTANGTAGISLRGMGADATLLLINGRRVSMSPFAQEIDTNFVDLNQIPVSAIERIEVLKDGASAVYGSDAVAGVINVVLRRDFSGSEVSLGYGNTTDTDASEQTASFIWGFGDDKSHGTLILDYFNNNALMNKDRSFADSADQRDRGGDDYRSSTGNPGSFRILDGVSPEQPDPNCAATSRRGTRCAYDYAPSNVLFPEAERTGLMFFGSKNLGDNLELFTEIAYQHNTSEAQGAPSPGTPVDDLILPASSPFNPYGFDVDFTRYRTTWAGPRQWDLESNSARLLAGLRGSIGDWDWEAAVNKARVSSVQSGSKGWVRVDRLREAFADGSLNPFAQADGSVTMPSQDVLDRVLTHVTRTGESHLTGIDAHITGDLFQMEHGALAMAAGVEYREEDVKDRPDKQFEELLIVGTEAVSAASQRDQWSAFIEFNIPMTEQLELQLAGRFDDYSDFGTTTNPKVALRWAPMDSLALRASYSTGFRAPSLAQTGLGPSEESPAVIDSVRCADLRARPDAGSDPVQEQIELACNAIEYSAFYVGNPDLDAEESESWNLGAIWEATDGLSFSLDYWNILQENVIDKDPQRIMSSNATTGEFRVERDAPAPGFTYGEVTRIYGKFENTGEQDVTGLDINVNWQTDLMADSKLTVDFNWTHLLKFDRQFVASGPTVDLVGEYEYPQDRFQLNADLAMENWGFTGTINYIGEFEDYVFDDDDADAAPEWDASGRKVDAYVSVNVQARYMGFAGTVLSVGVDNLFDEEPPFVNGDGDTDVYGYASNVHNPRGQFAYAKMTYSF